MWERGLPAIGREAVVKPVNAFCLTNRGGRFQDCFAARREQAPPQKPFCGYASNPTTKCTTPPANTITAGTPAARNATGSICVSSCSSTRTRVRAIRCRHLQLLAPPNAATTSGSNDEELCGSITTLG